MVDYKPPQVSFLHKIRFCILALFFPAQFAEEEARQMKEAFGVAASDSPETRARVYVVRNAFWRSFLVCASASVAGVLISWAAGFYLAKDAETAAWIGTAGAAVLLWGTLAVRGWEIQSFKGVTVAERVNRWLFVALYWIGTTALVTATSWTIFGNAVP